MSVVKKATPAAIAVLRQATALKPKRKKASDGLLPSAAHITQSPNSDHNTGLAVDLTDDPANGIDCKDIYQRLQNDIRVKYLIFKGKIWSKEKGEHVYKGSNQHNKHLHISINDGLGNDTSPWFWWMNQPNPLATLVASITSMPAKKPYPVVKPLVCTCCKVHSNTK